MRGDSRIATLNLALRRYHAGRLSRRQLMGMFGALGLSAAAAPWLLDRGAGAKSAPAGGHAGHTMAMTQGEGTPPPVATPQLGERPDGTRVWKVVAGGFSEPELIEATAFLPGEITINAGDSIFFEIQGFHNVTFPSGAEAPPFIIPETASGTPPASPAAGPPRLMFNPLGFFPAGGDTYDGTGFLTSGVPLDPTAPPIVITFTAPGTYDYVCTVHAEAMKARVIVQEAGAAYPQDQVAYDQLAAEELNALLEQGRALIQRHTAMASPAAGAGAVHEVAAGLSEGQVEVLDFLPRQLTIRAGDTVRWTNLAAMPAVPHTVTFAGGEAPPEVNLIEPQAGGPPKVLFNPVVVAPAGGPTYNGQGYANSGLLLPGAGTPTTFELTFDTAGTHRYYCAIHGTPEGGMVGDIVVEAAG